jgi:lipoate synthase
MPASLKVAQVSCDFRGHEVALVVIADPEFEEVAENVEARFRIRCAIRSRKALERRRSRRGGASRCRSETK